MSDTASLSTWWRTVKVRTDEYAGYEVVARYIWFPFCWFQFYVVNTHATPEAAVAFAIRHSRKPVDIKRI